MTRPASHPTLPFDDPAGDDGAPVAVTIRVAQPSLLSARAGLETDVAGKAPTNVWLRHVTMTLVLIVLDHEGAAGLAHADESARA